MQDKVILPSGHHVAAPANNRSVINAQRAVGNNQRLVNAYYSSESLATRTGTNG